MPKDFEFTVTITHNDKTYEGRRVVTVKAAQAMQYIISDEFHHSIQDPMPYRYPAETQQMEIAGQIIFAELLGKVGVM